MLDRIGRSWSGAFLDVLLIVGSILIAFMLDAWWDGRGRMHQEREALQALAGELGDSRAELDSVMAYNARRVETTSYFLELTESRIERLPLDSLGRATSAVFGGMTYDPSLGATEAIFSAGLDLVTDVELRARIAAWPGMLQEIEADQAAMLTRWEKVSDAVVEAGLAVPFFQFSDYQEDGPPDLAAARAFVRTMATDPRIRQRVAALGSSVGEVQEELAEVDRRLAALQASVARELEERS
ncbi:MAG: hypothetical protein PVF05_02745 [Gemmatimonadales bacterium]